MIRSRIGLGLLIAVLTLQEGSTRLTSSPQTSSTKPRAQLGCPESGEAALPISPGRLVECKLRPGDEHAFRITLNAGDFLQARVDQRGIDATVIFSGPTGEILLLMDSPNGNEGPEPVLAFAHRSDEYQLRVSGGGTGRNGTYRISVQEPRPATPVDLVRAGALQTTATAYQLASERPGHALQKYRAALEAWESIRDAEGQILVLERLSQLLMDQQMHSDALAASIHGLTLARELGDSLAEGRLTNLAGLAHLSLGDLDKARDLFERALNLLDQNQEDLQWKAMVLNNLALISEERGDLQEALRQYGESLVLWKQARNDVEQANTLANLGEVHSALGQPSEALSRFNQALNLLNLEDRRDIRHAVVDGAGLALNDLGLRQKAFLFLRRALALADTSEQKARTLHRLGQVHRKADDLQKAETVLEEALAFARSAENRRLEAYALADLANVDHRRGRPSEALRKFDQAQTLFEDLEVSLYVASSLFGRAEVERDLGYLEDAVASVKRSVEIVEALRAHLMEPGPRVSFFASRHRFYDLYLELLMEMHRREPGAGYDVRAFAANESARARTLLDDAAGGGRPVTAAMSLEEIQRELLDRATMLLVYSLGPRRSYLWAVSRDAIETFDLPAGTEVEKEVLQTWRQLSRKGGKNDLAALSRMLLPGGLDLRAGTRLLVSPDGVLHLIPFAALLGPDGSRLVSRHTTVYEPSASVLVGMRRNFVSRLPTPKGIAMMADPVFESDDLRLGEAATPAPVGGAKEFQRLILSGKEGRHILKLLPEGVNRFEAFGFGANRRAALDPALGQYPFVHFATHHKSGEDPDETGLVLSLFDEQGHPIEGLVRTTEVYNLDLPAELVVLSACGTGLAAEVRGEGPMGLPRAFFHAGAKRVVVSLWNVGDGATAELMTRFYRAMLQHGLSPAEALRSAQNSMASDPEWKDPRHWAPFILLGEPD